MLLQIVVAALLGQSNVSVVGKWEAWTEIDGRLTRFADAGYGAKWEYEFRSDGRFTADLVNHIMVNAVIHTDGTYKLASRKVIAKGKAHGSFDDGYKKETRDFEDDKSFEIKRGMLVLGSGLQAVHFVRVGAKPPEDLLNPKPKSSDPAAIALLYKVERKYGSMNLYRDRGTMKSSGKAFVAKDATFATRFDRSKKTFRYDLKCLDRGKTYETASAWSDGKNSWLYKSDTPPAEKRPLENGLGILSVRGGHTADLVPKLLFPKEFGGRPFAATFDRFVLDGKGKVSGHACTKLKMTSISHMSVTLWIDDKSLLIRRATDGFVSSDIRYEILQSN